MTKLFKEYLAESERSHQAPITGDSFDIIVNEQLVIEMQVVAHDSDSYVLQIDDFVDNFLLEHGLIEAKMKGEDPCWSGYEMVGTKMKKGKEVPNCVPKKKVKEQQDITEAEYQGRKVTLNKPSSGDVKKYKVYVKDPKTGNVKKVNFGDPNMKIKRDDPARKKAFRDRHDCANKKDKTTAGYWSCKMWSDKPVSKILKGK